MSICAMPSAIDRRVHWTLLLTELKAAGWALPRVSEHCQIPRSVLIAYRDHGMQPRHDRGERLIVLWVEVLGRRREDVPMIGRYDWRA